MAKPAGHAPIAGSGTQVEVSFSSSRGRDADRVVYEPPASSARMRETPSRISSRPAA